MPAHTGTLAPRRASYQTIAKNGKQYGRDVRALWGKQFKPLPQPQTEPRDVTDLSGLPKGALQAGFTGDVRSQYIDTATNELVTVYHPNFTPNDVTTRRQKDRVDHSKFERNVRRQRHGPFKRPKHQDGGSFEDDLPTDSEYNNPNERFRNAIRQRDYARYQQFMQNPFGAARDYVDRGEGLEEGVVPARFQLQHTYAKPSVRGHCRDAQAKARSHRHSGRIDAETTYRMPHDEAVELERANTNAFGVYSARITNKTLSKLALPQHASYSHLRSLDGNASGHGAFTYNEGARGEDGVGLGLSALDRCAVQWNAAAPKAARPGTRHDDELDQDAFAKVDARHAVRAATADGRLARSTALAQPAGIDRDVALQPGGVRAPRAARVPTHTLASQRRAEYGVEADGAVAYHDALRQLYNVPHSAAQPRRAFGTLDVAALQDVHNGDVAQHDTHYAIPAFGQRPDGLLTQRGVDAVHDDAIATHNGTYSAQSAQRRSEVGMDARDGVLHFRSPPRMYTAVEPQRVKYGTAARDDLVAPRVHTREVPRLNFRRQMRGEGSEAVDAAPQRQYSALSAPTYVNTTSRPTSPLRFRPEKPTSRTHDTLQLS